MYMSEACVTSPNAKARLRKLLLADLLKNKIKPGIMYKINENSSNVKYSISYSLFIKLNTIIMDF